MIRWRCPSTIAPALAVLVRASPAADALERWHDTGVPPDELAATHADRAGSRKLCAWPRKPVYVSGHAQHSRAYECR